MRRRRRVSQLRNTFPNNPMSQEALPVQNKRNKGSWRGSQLRNTVPKSTANLSPPTRRLLSSSRCSWIPPGEVDLGLSLREGGVVGYGISISMVFRVSYEIYA